MSNSSVVERQMFADVSPTVHAVYLIGFPPEVGHLWDSEL